MISPKFHALMRFFYFFLHFFCINTIYAQSISNPFTWFSTGKVSARITPTGIHSLIGPHEADGGGFLLHSDVPGVEPINLLSHMTIWVAGMDPAGNHKASGEMNQSFNSDWVTGFKKKPNSGLMWKVTSEQITLHRADFEDNGVIDHPIPAIYAWPGCMNSHSDDYNGFDMRGIDYYSAAPFFDKNANGIYDAENGDYPYFYMPEYQSWSSKRSMLFAPFYDDELPDASRSTQLEGNLLAFTFDCIDNDFVKNSIFFHFGSFQNTGTERLDSVYFGIYADFNIGNPKDDYLGSTTLNSQEKVFCYNSDTLYDSETGANPPMISLMSFDGVIDSDGSGNSQRLQYFTPIYKGSDFPVPTHFSAIWGNNPFQRLTGKWSDGTPMTKGGIGYNGTERARYAFPDHPTDPAGWSELAANNPKGDRACVISYGPTTMMPQGWNPGFTFAITVSDKTGLTQQLQNLSDMRRSQGYLLDWWWDLPSPLDTIYCQPSLETTEALSGAYVSLSPNPCSNYVTISSAESDIHDLTVFDFTGKVILRKIIRAEKTTLNTANLPAGIYIVQCLLENGRRSADKIVISR